MQTEPGTLSFGRGGPLFLSIAGETYRLTRDDIHTLLFYGQSVPLTRTEDGDVCPDGAVIVTTVPFASFQQVARGEAVSAPLFPAMPDVTGGLV